MNFWEKLQKPFFILAPMEGVTDTVFRQIVVSTGRPDVFFTEFVPVDALLSEGHEKILGSLKFTEKERPIVAQIWGTDPEKFYTVAKMLHKMKFDGIDINMGCPDKNATKKGACAALIKNPKLAKEIIEATIKGANGLPVSVKTRIGFREIDTENWVTTLLQTPISALTLHLRTAREMSKPPAHWEEIRKAVIIRNKLSSKALIIGNGDVKSLKEAKDKCKEYGIDGIMIGRGIFENIWLFNDKVDIEKVTPQQKIDLLIKHLELFKQTWDDNKHFALMKKFVKCYVNNFKGAVEVRDKLMKTRTLDELIEETRLISFDSDEVQFGVN
ncbi:hypothetical protein A3D83_04585 [Candidatus Daviesbacteria bacterium RIFCSPHIGHO2_02_FULL_41_10]|uniref:tRNA-dihydrouridine synthase n=3 Tax=Candidatus Daviesiibacteriota TaxID=1752718 RepID=A0A1F5IRA9_9BACT|nr:MAG: hypothetical protein A2871_02710 [Candidatus Daviesbacteria bacterium RIFCSPHIGHO2_01_FULL_41_23]OGE33821.1 MAG: hypothetical protein A3D83_04585 [Candidatus Daviesbacteria bacterium RIFCSPHIGHO2_02_FULL_41_10]OGE62088.1 MAG: hypothetical protein A2967_00325 [Candidatus Daviesbacteria bacterium RIFCSPLOWO2_01_FULL_41_32]